jgi:aryl-alcohol dehydrogenase-like predicted oxidoreductase
MRFTTWSFKEKYFIWYAAFPSSRSTGPHLHTPQGISDAPAWIVPKANQYAKDHGKTPFSIYQGRWSVLERSFERDIIPMARAEGLALAPWDVLGGGKIRSDAEEARRRETGEKGRTILDPNWERTEEERKVCLVLEQIAKEVGTESITSGALYLQDK